MDLSKFDIADIDISITGSGRVWRWVRKFALFVLIVSTVFAGVVVSGLLAPIGFETNLVETKSGAAVVKAQTIEKATRAYHVSREKWPASLYDLLKKDDIGEPYLESEDMILDPWGKLYQYDPSGPIHKKLGQNEVPDIFTVDPNTGDTLGNFPFVQAPRRGPSLVSSLALVFGVVFLVIPGVYLIWRKRNRRLLLKQSA